MKIDPRYGSWSAKDMNVLPSLSGGLATAAAGASAAAAPVDPAAGAGQSAG